MKKDIDRDSIIKGIAMTIITIIIMAIALPKVTVYSQDLAIICGCACVLMILDYFFSKEIVKISERVTVIILVPNCVMFLAQFKPELLQVNICIIYLFVVINIIMSYVYDKLSQKLLLKFASKIDDKFYKSL